MMKSVQAEEIEIGSFGTLEFAGPYDPDVAVEEEGFINLNRGQEQGASVSILHV